MNNENNTTEGSEDRANGDNKKGAIGSFSITWYDLIFWAIVIGGITQVSLRLFGNDIGVDIPGALAAVFSMVLFAAVSLEIIWEKFGKNWLKTHPYIRTGCFVLAALLFAHATLGEISQQEKDKKEIILQDSKNTAEAILQDSANAAGIIVQDSANAAGVIRDLSVTLATILRADTVNADRVKGEVGAVKADVGGVKGDVGRMEIATTSIKDEVGEVKADVGGVKREVEAVKGDLNEASEKLGDILEELKAIRQALSDSRNQG